MIVECCLLSSPALSVTSNFHLLNLALIRLWQAAAKGAASARKRRCLASITGTSLSRTSRRSRAESQDVAEAHPAEASPAVLPATLPIAVQSPAAEAVAAEAVAAEAVAAEAAAKEAETTRPVREVRATVSFSRNAAVRRPVSMPVSVTVVEADELVEGNMYV